jgi:EAL domain-containing protein (putative c-di-GMP-specific phosphodiesterase class I)
MDDFGTGHAALTQLSRAPFDFVKIERAFVSDLAAGSRAETLIAGVVGLARGLGMGVVAEGVETEEQQRRLMAVGCSFGQGYHFAKPMPLTALRRYLKSHSGNETPATRRAPARRAVPEA